jgi:hypothetical protein
VSESDKDPSPAGDPARLARALAAFAQVNAEDPKHELVDGVPRPHEQVQAERLAAWIERLEPHASEALRLAAHCQHIRRWRIAREQFPSGRAGYLKWRAELARFHAETASAILTSLGYDSQIIDAVRRINLKQGLNKQGDVQTMEDALCLSFLEHELAAFVPRYPEQKVLEILRKTWKKMSERARNLALALELPPSTRALIERALAAR